MTTFSYDKPAVELLKLLILDGDGGKAGEEEDAGAQRAGKTPGGGERTTAGAEAGHGRLSRNRLTLPSGDAKPLSVCSVSSQEEDMRRAKEEQEKREEEEYLKLKASFIVEDQGEEEQLTQDQVAFCISSTFWFWLFLGCVLK